MVGVAVEPEVRLVARARPLLPALVFLAGQGLSVLAVWAVAVPSGWSLWRLLHQWDAQHFEALARSGYTADTYAFFPGFPLLLRLVTAVTALPLDVAGVIVSLAAGITLAYGVDRLAAGAGQVGTVGKGTAVALVGVLPLSVVFLMPYSEATFCALAVWALVALREDRPLLGAALCAVAGLVRPTAAALVVAVVVAAVVAAVRYGDRRRAAVAVLVAPLGLAGYLGWVGWRTGSVTGWADRESEGWRTRFDGGAYTLSWLRTIAVGGPSAVDLLIVVAAVACVAAAAVLVRRRRFPEAAYVAGVVVLALGTSGVWNSKYRLMLPALVVGCALAGPALGRLRTPVRVVVLVVVAAVGCCFSAYLLTSYPYAL